MAAPDLRLDWLRAFVAIVDSGSLSAAAPHVHRSQGAVSVQLAKLEGAVGQPLVRRGARRAEPTAAGAELLGYARRMLALNVEALSSIGTHRLTGRLRAGVPDDYAAPYFAPVLQAFAAMHEAVHVELLCEQSTALIPKVQNGDLDLAIVSRHRANYGTRLFSEPLVWVGAPQHGAWRRTPLPVACYESGSMARKAALQALNAAGIAHRVVYDSASLVGQLAAVDAGLAVAVLTRCSVPAHLAVLGRKHGLPALSAMEVAVLRSRASKANAVVDAMHAAVLQQLARTA
jgi:DNA-binding transcriptional LysR family regulator